MKTISDNETLSNGSHAALKTVAQVNNSPLTAADRCDACGHRAYIRAELVMGEFTFCGHHGRHLRPAMEQYLINFDDQTANLDPRKY